MPPKELREKLKMFSYITLGLFALLLIKLAFVQFYQGGKYETLAKANRIRLVSIPAPRGEIYDRNGKLLAQSRLVYTVSLTYLDLKDEDMVVNLLSEILIEKYPEATPEYIKSLIEKQKYRLFEPIVIERDIDWATVVRLEEHRQQLPGMEITVEPLRNYPEGTLAGHVLGYIRGIYNREELDKYYDTTRYKVGDLVGKSGLERVYEKYLRGTDGARQVEVDVAGNPVNELVTLKPKAGNNLVLTLDRDLQRVMEKTLDQVLAQSQKSNLKAKVGSCVLLDVKTGAVLAMASAPKLDPNDFIRPMSQAVSNYYNPQGSRYDPLNPGAEMNRAIQATYPPGSTFKPITGMAALEAGKLDPERDTVDCKGAYWIKPYIKCWQVHGIVNLYEALAGSCNTFFQEAGRRAGAEMIIKVAHEFGLGQKTGIDLPHEAQGLLPTPEYKKETQNAAINRLYAARHKELEKMYDDLMKNADTADKKEKLARDKERALNRLNAQYEIDYNFETKWQPYDTFNMSIGQGDNKYTVIQLANYVATIANDGKRMRPYLVQKVVDPSGNVIEEFKPQMIEKADVKPQTIAEMKKAMNYAALPGGTAYYIFSGLPKEISGGAKTGTAQTSRIGDNKNKDYHGVFIAFAPYDDPQIAFAGVVEYGYHGSSSAGIVAKAVFEQYFGVKDYLADEKTSVAGEEATNQLE